MNPDEFVRQLKSKLANRTLHREAQLLPELVRNAIEEVGYEFLSPSVSWQRDRFVLTVEDRFGFGKFELFSLTTDGYIHPRFSVRSPSSWLPFSPSERNSTRRGNLRKFLQYGRVSIQAIPSERRRLRQALASGIREYARAVKLARASSREDL